MKRWIACCIASAFMLVAGCQYNPHAHRFSKHEPTVAEAAGTYVLDEVFVDSVQHGLGETIQKYAATSQIVLRHDGTAKFTRFPVLLSPDDSHYTYKGPEDFDARWAVAAVGGVSSGGDHSETVYGIQFTFEDDRTLFDTPTFTGTPSVDGMVFTISDPDMGEILGFRKK